MDVAREYAVVTFSPQPSVADFLKRVVGAAGFACQAVSTAEDLHRSVEAVMPDAIVYEIGFPFSDNWHRLLQLRAGALLRDVPFVITTSDAPELFRRVGVPALTLLGRPEDLSALRHAILSAIEPTRTMFEP